MRHSGCFMLISHGCSAACQWQAYEPWGDICMNENLAVRCATDIDCPVGRACHYGEICLIPC